MGQRFTIEGELPALNEIIGASKTHWSAYKHERDKAMFRARTFIRLARLRPMETRIRFTAMYWCPDRRKDPDNISAFARKTVLDALQAEGILPNDGHRQIAGFCETFFVDKDRPRIEIELCEVI